MKGKNISCLDDAVEQPNPFAETKRDGLQELSAMVKDAAIEQERQDFLASLRDKQRKECIEDAIAFRELKTGVILTVMPLLFDRGRLTVGNDWTAFEYFYDYDSVDIAIKSMQMWEPENEPVGWTRKTTRKGTQYSEETIVKRRKTS